MSPLPLVMDSSVLINLHNGGVLDKVFKLPFKFTTTDFIQMETILDWSLLSSLGLQVIHFTGPKVLEIEQINKQKKLGLSIQDISVFVSARENKWFVLSDDKPLRAFSLSNGLTVHGSIWLLDEMIAHHIFNGGNAVLILGLMLLHNARFPQDICRQKVTQWSKKKNE